MDNLRAQFGAVDSDADEYGLGEEEAVREPPPSPIGQDERRMQVRAYNHWASLLGNNNFPSIEDLDPDLLPDFGPHSVLLDFTNGIDDPAIRYLGATLAEECDTSPGIARLSDVPHRSLLTRITDHYMQILANQAPIGFEAEFVNQRGSTILYRGILLPYSSDDDTIDFIYGVINWKEMADQLTSDALLEEIDSALEAEAPRLPAALTDWADGPGMAENDDSAPVPLPRSPLATKPTDDRFPQPAFGVSDDADEDDGDDTGLYEAIEAVDDEPEGSTRFASLLSLGGGKGASASFDDDEDEEDYDDEDPVAKWLARPTALSNSDAEPEPFELTENAFVGSDADEAEPAWLAREPLELIESAVEEAPGDFADEPLELVEQYDAEHAPFELDAFADEPLEAAPEPDAATLGIHDCLAAARELALAARASEDRSRSALYAAVGRAYDFSIAAQAEPAEFAELVADSGLTVQDRAPMTPVVKLVFGADYDKTRIAEYASVLSFAHREGIERGTLGDFLSRYDGGLKGVVQAERELKKGGETGVRETPREALARKLRAIAPLGFEDIDPEGEEFAVVVIRRVDGEVVVLGEVSDVPLVEKVARKLVA